jgi:hypothetical protein
MMHVPKPVLRGPCSKAEGEAAAALLTQSLIAMVQADLKARLRQDS